MWEIVGIPEPDERVYEAMIPLRPCTAANLAEHTGLTPARTARILGRLVDRGLATRLPGRPARFFAVMPDLAAAALIAAQESKLGQLRAYAQQIAASRRGPANDRHPAELIEVIEGAGNVRSAFVRLQREARKEMRVFEKPPYTGAQPDGNPEEYRLLDEGRIRYRTVYDKGGLAEPGRLAEIRSGIRRGERARVGSPPMKMALSDSRLALIPVVTSGYAASHLAYIVHLSSLLDALSELFEIIWAKAIPLNQRPGLEVGEDMLTDRDRDLLGLLAAGSTDEMMARTFGWSVRTVQRHVHRIMTLVSAETRFQAGQEASRRGWI
jgi:DNA-binding CsgD family transcriptional regulator